jgi:hypothetical protein
MQYVSYILGTNNFQQYDIILSPLYFESCGKLTLRINANDLSSCSLKSTVIERIANDIKLDAYYARIDVLRLTMGLFLRLTLRNCPLDRRK